MYSMQGMSDELDEFDRKFLMIVVKIIDDSSEKIDCFKTNQQFSTLNYVETLFIFFRNSIYWKRFSRKINNKKMTGKQLNKKHLEYVNNGIYEKIYKHILELYFTIDKYEKLKIQSID